MEYFMVLVLRLFSLLRLFLDLMCKLQYVNLNMQSNMHVSMRVACWKTMKGKKEHHTTGQGASSPSRPGRPGSPFSPLKPRKPCL